MNLKERLFFIFIIFLSFGWVVLFEVIPRHGFASFFHHSQEQANLFLMLREGLLEIPPSSVFAFYSTGRTVLRPDRLEQLITLIHETGFNALVIDVKDGEGLYLRENMRRVVNRLKGEGIYPIARIAVFQDTELAGERPDLALKTYNDFFWIDRGKYLWVDPASQEVWDYNVAVAIQAARLGFLELNFDYVRFPSHGNPDEVKHPFYDGVKPKADVIADFFSYLTSTLRRRYPTIVLSVDLFAYSFVRDDDVGIGQQLNRVVDYFDVVSPMIYPSHYSSGNFGVLNPAEYPYLVVYETLMKGKEILTKAGKEAVIRPWIQDFDLGAVYDAHMIGEEVRAVYEAGLQNGFMIWNPSNKYEKAKFLGVFDTR